LSVSDDGKRWWVTMIAIARLLVVEPGPCAKVAGGFI
jgi:hypothetical protein